jgi:hypothetical protein
MGFAIEFHRPDDEAGVLADLRALENLMGYEPLPDEDARAVAHSIWDEMNINGIGVLRVSEPIKDVEEG